MKNLYRNDILLNLIIILACIVIPTVMFFSSQNDAKFAIVSYDGNVEKEIPLDEENRFVVHGVEIVVSEGMAFVSDSDCPDGLCMKMKNAKNVGDSIICVPNKVSVRIVGEQTGEEADVVAG